MSEGILPSGLIPASIALGLALRDRCRQGRRSCTPELPNRLNPCNGWPGAFLHIPLTLRQLRLLPRFCTSGTSLAFKPGRVDWL